MRSISVQSREIRRVLITLGAQSDLPTKLDSRIEIIQAEKIFNEELIHSLLNRYTPLEICCALKPHALRAMLGAGADTAHFIDPDTYFYSDADILPKLVEASSLLLTPHCLHPVPADAKRPHPLSILRAGQFNAGYVGVAGNESGYEFLDWWASRLEHYGFNAPHLGMCADQRWLDFCPVLFPELAILRSSGANVAYWNLHERQLSQVGERFYVDEEALLFFHFSGFNPARPQLLSKYQDRIQVSESLALQNLLEQYAHNLTALTAQLAPLSDYSHHRLWHGESWLARTWRNWRRQRYLRAR